MSLDDRDAVLRAKKAQVASYEALRRRRLRELFTITSHLNRLQFPGVDLSIDIKPNPEEQRFLDENDISKGRNYRNETLRWPALKSSFHKATANDAGNVTNHRTEHEVYSPAHGHGHHSSLSEQQSSPVDSRVDIYNAPLATRLSPNENRSRERRPGPKRPHADGLIAKGAPRPKFDDPETNHNTVSANQIHDAAARMPKDVEAESPGRFDEQGPPLMNDVGTGLSLINGHDTSQVSSANGTRPMTQRNTHDDGYNGDERSTDPLSLTSTTKINLSSKTSALDGHVSNTRHRLSNASPQSLLGANDRPSTKLPTSSGTLALPATRQMLSSSTGGQYFDGDRHAMSQVNDLQPATVPRDIANPNKKQHHRVTNMQSDESKYTSLTYTDESANVASTSSMPDAAGDTSRSVEQLLTRMDGAHRATSVDKQPGPSLPLARSTEADRNLNDEKLTKSTSILSQTSKQSHHERPISTAKRKSAASRSSTVFFPKRYSSSYDEQLGEDKEYSVLRGASSEEGRDYLLPLFRWQAHQPPRSIPLLHLMSTASKVVSTSNQLCGIREEHDYRILKRIYQLQNVNRWSFRQLTKSREPSRPATSLDALLSEMKWMQTDYREERSWKMSLTKQLAQSCASWVSADTKERKALQVTTTRTKRTSDQVWLDQNKDAALALRQDLANDKLDEHQLQLKHPKKVDAGDRINLAIMKSIPQTRIFSPGIVDLVLNIDIESPSQNLLNQLPWFKSENNQSANDSHSPNKSDTHVVAVSRYLDGKLICDFRPPKRKRSRYDHEEEEGSREAKRLDSAQSVHSIHTVKSMSLLASGRSNRVEESAEQTDVALFNPENKHVRDRLHASHAFRPPSEFGMPPTSFFENRVSSQWLWDEDQKLRTLVRDYSYNWSLISASLSLPSRFTSGAERRTPWECFERWVQLEGLPAEMSKTPYFKTYQSRLEAAQRTVLAQYQASTQQSQPHGQLAHQPIGTPTRRRTTQPIRVERRKTNRYLGWIDGMRKLARKRETTQHNKQEAAKAAALRKAHETVQPRTQIHTPQQLSQIKYEREVKLQQSLEIQRQKTLAYQRNLALQRAAQQNGQSQLNVTGNASQLRNENPNNGQNFRVVGQANSQQAGPFLSHISTNGRHPPLGQQNSHGASPVPGGNPSGPAGALQAQMQHNIVVSGRIAQTTNDNIRFVAQQRAIQGSNIPFHVQQHQQQMQQQQQRSLAPQQQHGINNPDGTPLMNTSGNVALSNRPYPAAPSNLNLAAPPTLDPFSNNIQQSSSSSPSLTHSTAARSHAPPNIIGNSQLNSNNASPQLSSQTLHLSAEQLQQLANEKMKGQLYQQSRQNALNVAAGAAASSHGSLGSQQGFSRQPLPGNTPMAAHQYQQQIRQQMLQQRSQQAGSPIINLAQPSNGSATSQSVVSQQQQQQQHTHPHQHQRLQSQPHPQALISQPQPMSPSPQRFIHGAEHPSPTVPQAQQLGHG